MTHTHGTLVYWSSPLFPPGVVPHMNMGEKTARALEMTNIVELLIRTISVLFCSGGCHGWN